MITPLMLVRATYMCGVVLHAHPVRVESHNQRNTTEEVATILFAVYLDDLSLETSSIKAGYYIGEILLNHLTSVDDICVFFPSVCGL